MPRRKERFDLEKQTIKLFAGDFSRMRDLYPKTGANRIIRELIHRHISVTEEMAQKKLQSVEAIQIDLSDIEEPNARPAPVITELAEGSDSSRSVRSGPGEADGSGPDDNR